MTAPQLPPADDEPGRSPRLLQKLPKRGPGVRRLNKVPVFVFVAGVCLVVGAIGYTYRARLQSSTAALHDTDAKPEAASGAAVLNGAPQAGEIQSAVYRPMAVPPPAQPSPSLPAQAQRGPSDGGQQQQAQEDDPAAQAPKQAWPT